LRVTAANLAQGIDILIGMDIINQGDFALTHPQNETWFSFQSPYHEEIDFTKKVKINSSNTPKKIPRNSPCPCGSGKKHKKCCGKTV